MPATPASDGTLASDLERRIHELQRDALVARLPDEIKSAIVIIDDEDDQEQSDGDTFFLYGYMPSDGSMGRNTTAALQEFLSEIGEADATIRINSTGGSLSTGVAMYNLMREHKGKLTAKVDGFCASAATLPFLACDDRLMGTGTQLMIHNASAVIYGDHAAHTKAAAMLKQMSESMESIYEARTGLDAAALKSAMDDETYYSADDAVKNGFATGKVEGEEGSTTPGEDDTEAMAQNFTESEAAMVELNLKLLDF